MFCLKCKTNTGDAKVTMQTTKNNRLQRCGLCVKCGTRKSQFVKKTGGGLLNNAINNLPFEMHWPGHHFLGPGTKLNKRLNDDLTPKDWSVPVDRDDAVAYKHDLCYLKNKDTPTRNRICDTNMVNELNAINNPTSSERRHIAFAKRIIGAKKRLGWGLKKNHPPPFFGLTS